jgi:nicotinate-nucleotide adenylyltransferase
VNNFFNTWKEKNSRVIVFAGVFDPVHIGHISAAQKALNKYGSEVVFLPEREPQHKHKATEYKNRLEMLKIATKSQKNINVLDYPNKNQFISETFEWLGSKFPARKFVWLVGSDVLPNINKWPGSEKLTALNVVQIVTFRRNETTKSNFLKEIGGAQVIYENRSRRMQNHNIISSSFILQDIKNRQSALPAGVYSYIKQNNLYTVSDSTTEK